MSIQAVPKDILNLVFLNMTAVEAAKAKEVCKAWKRPAEDAAKQLQVKEFKAMVDKAAQLFRKMTSKSALEFVPYLRELKVGELTSGQIHHELKNIIIRKDCCFDCSDYLSAAQIDKRGLAEMKEIGLNESPEHIFLPIIIGKAGERGFIKSPLGGFPVEPAYFPNELFAIKEGEQTAFPFKNRIVILTARQTQIPWSSFWRRHILKKFEDYFSDALSIPFFYIKSHDCKRFYIWQRDAHQ